MKNYKRMMQAAPLFLLLAALSGCSLAGFLLSGCGDEDADLVLRNDGRQVIGQVELYLNKESQGACAAKEGEGLEYGESWGFSLPDGQDNLMIRIFDRYGETLAQGRCDWPGQGERLWVVYDGDGGLRFSWAEGGR